MKKRILFLLQFPPPVHGSAIIGERIKNSMLLNNYFSGTYVNISTSNNMKEIGKRPVIKMFRFITIFKKILFSLINHKYDLSLFAITSKGVAFYRDVIIIFLLKIFHIKYILLMNNKGVKESQYKFIDNFFYKFVFNDINVIQNSEKLYKDIVKYVSKDRVFVLPNGIPDNPFAPTIIKPEYTRIIYLGNMTISKGIFALVDACNILKKNGLKFECIFVGAWNDVTPDEFNSYVLKNNLKEEVHYLGKKYGKQKHEVLSQSDIFVFPTFYNYECFPLVLLEAMQHSLPVISTFEGGIPDIVEDGKTGFLVPQRNTEALADKLEVLITNPQLRKKMGEAGRLKYEKEFTLDRFENRLNDILTKIVSNENGYR